jgi:hypothetical protein
MNDKEVKALLAQLAADTKNQLTKMGLITCHAEVLTK